jgi:hypothetical protein
MSQFYYLQTTCLDSEGNPETHFVTDNYDCGHKKAFSLLLEKAQQYSENADHEVVTFGCFDPEESNWFRWFIVVMLVTFNVILAIKL